MGRQRLMTARRRRTGVMLLETQLDKALAARRSQIAFMREFFSNFPDIKLVPKEIHSRADLRKFLVAAKKSRWIRAIHLVAHGSHRGSLVLTQGESVNLHKRQNQRLFSGLRNKVIFFSCCDLGQDENLMKQLLRTSGA